MGKYEKLLARILRGASDTDIPFRELCNLLQRFGFNERVRGDHHIFTKDKIEDILNLQPRESKAKPYQVKQVRNLILQYRLKLGKEDE
jgi:predicted RNA binding protein YcfA (HicA-like mRNA interferase family)